MSEISFCASSDIVGHTVVCNKHLLPLFVYIFRKIKLYVHKLKCFSLYSKMVWLTTGQIRNFRRVRVL